MNETVDVCAVVFSELLRSFSRTIDAQNSVKAPAVHWRPTGQCFLYDSNGQPYFRTKKNKAVGNPALRANIYFG